MRAPSRFLLSAIAVLGLVGGSCGSDDDDSAGSAITGDIIVFAAASLTESFTEIGELFMSENPDATVTLSFAASSELVTQITEGGAPADVFASADEANMTKITDAGANVGDPQIFATNLLQIIVQPGNPTAIASVEDLANPDILFVTCPPEVPIGRYTQQVFDAAGVTVTPVSLEENVRGIVTKVTTGEADAGIVYKTDVIAAGDQAEGVDIPQDINVTATYPIVDIAEGANPDGAAAFIEFVLSDAGQEILGRHGFGAP